MQGGESQADLGGLAELRRHRFESGKTWVERSYRIVAERGDLCRKTELQKSALKFP